jgi:hypothetical protein
MNMHVRTTLGASRYRAATQESLSDPVPRARSAERRKLRSGRASVLAGTQPTSAQIGALRALPDGPPATVCNDGRLHGTAPRGGSWSAWLGSDRGMAVRAQAQWIALSAA